MANGSLTELMRVLQFGDSTLPVGAFAFSNALESALQTGVVSDVASLENFVLAATRQAAALDGVALLHAHRAALSGDFAGVIRADTTLLQRRVGEEQRLMTTRMGKKLAELGIRLSDEGLMGSWLAAIRAGKSPGCFAIAHALMFAGRGLPEQDAFAVHQYGVASMMLGAALRLMKIDHYDTQTLLYRINATVDDAYARARTVALDEMAGFAPVFDVLVAHHVKAHVRMFMN
ncbi:urease accessory UreF family protein [Craterilacuibacter sp. RT1T]|uniref:urease accessory protein UreF n=1 Tax=Craterilacuibacter sp. RT1T TaxID=2942211 RepID=UPI0020BF38C9|nr:urease accessory UreF family protein [Craterilacuibacter sp. RT1T]MCL6263195.1 urease accessory protein UreF [Craterilacuibacter sp. RT1T]